jgi:hypothetical protein
MGIGTDIKHCPKCGREYHDSSINYCVADAVALVDPGLGKESAKYIVNEIENNSSLSALFELENYARFQNDVRFTRFMDFLNRTHPDLCAPFILRLTARDEYKNRRSLPNDDDEFIEEALNNGDVEIILDLLKSKGLL